MVSWCHCHAKRNVFLEIPGNIGSTSCEALVTAFVSTPSYLCRRRSVIVSTVRIVMHDVCYGNDTAHINRLPMVDFVVLHILNQAFTTPKRFPADLCSVASELRSRGVFSLRVIVQIFDTSRILCLFCYNLLCCKA